MSVYDICKYCDCIWTVSSCSLSSTMVAPFAVALSQVDLALRPGFLSIMRAKRDSFRGSYKERPPSNVRFHAVHMTDRTRVGFPHSISHPPAPLLWHALPKAHLLSSNLAVSSPLSPFTESVLLSVPELHLHSISYDAFAATSRVLHHGEFSSRPFRLHFREMDVSLMSVMTYTSKGNLMFRYNDALRHAERRRVFNVDGLCQLAAESVNRSPDDIVNFEKFAEGGFNRIFLITLRGDFQMIARIPYPVTVPNYHAVASEVATMSFLRSCGMPVPEVYGYSPTPDNVAETEFVFMEFVGGIKLSNVWPDFGEKEIIQVLRQIVELESKIMSISFPAGGSLYYAKDLEKLGGRPGIPLADEQFCVGPDVRLPLWFGRRSQLDVDRGPCTPLSVFFVLLP